MICLLGRSVHKDFIFANTGLSLSEIMLVYRSVKFSMTDLCWCRKTCNYSTSIAYGSVCIVRYSCCNRYSIYMICIIIFLINHVMFWEVLLWNIQSKKSCFTKNTIFIVVMIAIRYDYELKMCNRRYGNCILYLTRVWMGYTPDELRQLSDDRYFDIYCNIY